MKPLKFVFIFLLVLLVLFTNLKLYSLNFNYYQKEFTKLNVYDNIPQANEHALNLIKYMNNKEELSNFFNEQEKTHLHDVKYLINLAFIIFYLVLILTLMFLMYFIYNKKYLIILDSLITSSLIIILLQIIFLITNFSSNFLLFHEILFTNNLWLFNPEDNIVNLFPEEFFYDISLKIMLNSLIISLILIVSSLIIRFKVNKRFLNK